MSTKEKSENNPKLVADWNTLIRTFIKPENGTTEISLNKYMEQILFGLHDFLKKHVGITEEMSVRELSERYSDTTIKKNPQKKLADVIKDIILDIAPHAVNVSSPYFIGHMTSAIPFFMVNLKTIVSALNQNVVKMETSKVVSIIEKQVIAKLHRLIYQRDASFYQQHVQNPETTLGCFVEDGTIANITALWVARNALFSKRKDFEGVEKEGIHAAYETHNINKCVILVSRYGHYSLKKAGGVLGLGNKNVISIDVDENHRLDTNSLYQTIKELNRFEKKTKILAVIGIAGATETGKVDPLGKIAEICHENKIHFHVDAAWGGPVLMSDRYQHLLKGINLADSVTIDGHKQFYMPMSCGMVYFKNPTITNAISYQANYVLRPGSVDLGRKSLSGSREANSLILDSALKIMGTRGYALLIEHGIDTAKKFAREIESRCHFQLIIPPELNILTYRICPDGIKRKLAQAAPEKQIQINRKLNEINRKVQRIQRERGNSFVSRTLLRLNHTEDEKIVVFRSVLMNPLTNIAILKEILDEQEKIYLNHFT
jgi:glutamate decarboxylase